MKRTSNDANSVKVKPLRDEWMYDPFSSRATAGSYNIGMRNWKRYVTVNRS